MNPLRVVEFDIHGKNPKNKIDGEIIPLTNKTCQWVIPDGSPFFGDYPAAGGLPITIVYDDKGRELVRDRDYWLEEEFMPLVEVTGRPVVCFIRTSDAVRQNNAFIKVNYISVGAYFIPRNNLEEWLKTIETGKIPIPWDKIFGVPPTLPSEWHSHSAKTEIGDWFEFTLFFKYMAENIKTRNGGQADRDLEAAVDASWEQLIAQRDLQFDRMRDHTSNYNRPHGITPKDVDMGNHPNFPTATLAEELMGTRSDRLSTPQGVQELLRILGPDSSNAMRKGALALSKFGNNNYIPPGITGSFEGMGSETECSGICQEADGSLMLLSNHYDGRVRGLYFTKVEGWATADPKHSFTNVQYNPPALANKGLVANRIIMGSGNKVLMVGLEGTNEWYLTMTNGTFDPRAHALAKCDMSAVIALIADPAAPNYSQSHNAVIHHMGDYLILVQSYNKDSSNLLGRQGIFRVAVSDVASGRPVTWTRINVSYTTYDNAARSGQVYLELVQAIAGGDGYTRLGPFTIQPSMTEFVCDYRVISLSSPKAASPGLFNFTLVSWWRLGRYKGSEQRNTYGVMEFTFNFNPATGAFTTKTKPTAHTFNFAASTEDNIVPDQAAQYSNLADALAYSPAASTVLLDTGEMVSTLRLGTGLLRRSQLRDFPIQPRITKIAGRNTPEQVLDGRLDNASAALIYQRLIKPVFTAPLASGAFPSGISYQPTGEIYSALNHATLKREVFFRTVAGAYQNLPAAKNMMLGDVNGRPLSSSVYSTNLLHHDPLINVTGDATALTLMSVDSGFTAMSACGYSEQDGVAMALPTNPVLRATNPTGALITFPRTYSWTVDEVTKKASAVGQTFYGINQTIIDRLATYAAAPSATSRGFCFSLFMLNNDVSAKFLGVNLVVAQVSWEDVADGLVRTRVGIFTPTIERPNTAHPGTYLITELAELASPIAVKANERLISEEPSAPQFTSFQDRVSTPVRPTFGNMPEKPMLAIYRTGTTLKVVLTGCHTVNVGFYVTLVNIFDIDIGYNTIKELSSGGQEIGYGDSIVAIPRVGLSDFTKKVVKNPGTTYPPATPLSYRCSRSGKTCLHGDVVYPGMGHSGNADAKYGVGPTFIKISETGADTSHLYMYCEACGLNGPSKVDQGEINNFTAQHFVTIPGYTPPVIDLWTCRNSGAKTNKYKPYFEPYKVPVLLTDTRAPNGTFNVKCLGCDTTFGGGNTKLQYANVTNFHFIHTTGVIPDEPDDIYHIPPFSPYQYSGGGATLYKKTVGSSVAYYLLGSTYPESRWSIFFLEEVEVMFAGTMYRMTPGLIDLRDIDANPANKTFNVYATMEGQKAQYIVTDTKLRTSSKVMHVAVITTGPSQVMTIERRTPFMIGSLEVSYNRKGGIIPVSSGFPQDLGNFTFLRLGELMN